MPSQSKLFSEYTDLLCKEIVSFENAHSGLLSNAETLYLGGGTPSELPPEFLRRIFECLRFVGVDSSKLKEVSMEFNPESTNEATLRSAQELGVNRVSLGIQSFDPEILKMVGRSHSVETGVSALRLLTSTSNLQVNGDLMFDLPGQTTQGFLDDVDQLSDFPLNHVSFYGLNVSPRSRLGHRVARGELTVNEDLYEAMYMGGVEILERKGLMRYEVSNFARPGFESVHNQNYWNRGEYAGFGPGAHSYLRGMRYYAPEIYPRWREYVLSDCPESMLSLDKLDREASIMEFLWLSLRQSRGICSEDLEKMGISLDKSVCERWISKGFLKHGNLSNLLQSKSCLRLEGRGWIFMDDIVTDLANTYSNLE
jgi:oxygen-independent coproporphyrinogen-3 oxidase